MRGRVGAVGLTVLLVLAAGVTQGQSIEEGVALQRAGKLQEAKSVFESVLSKDRRNAEVHYRLGLMYLTPALRDLDKAVEHMEEAVEINPNNADYQYGLGAAYGMEAQSAGVFRQALLAPRVKSAFEKAVQLDPRHIEARIGLAQYYQRAPGIMGGDKAKAWKEAEAIIALDEVRGRTFKASLFEGEKKLKEAEEEYTTLLKSKGSDWRAWRSAGLFYLRHQRTDDAVSVFKKYAEMRPDTADSYCRLAQAYIQKKDPDQALAMLTKCFSLEQDFLPALPVLARAYELKGQKREARDTYQRLLKADLTKEQRQNIEKKIKELSN